MPMPLLVARPTTPETTAPPGIYGNENRIAGCLLFLQKKKMKQIAFVTDTHLQDPITTRYAVDAESNWQRILADLKDRNITDVIFGGDIGEADILPHFFGTLQPFNLHLVLGNHDSFDDVAPYFNPGIQGEELYYHVDSGDTRFIFMDSSAETISDMQLEWLSAELSSDKLLIVCIHHPVLNTGTAMDRLYPLKNRDAVSAILQQSNKPVYIFCGHYHTSDERTENNITQFVTRAASFQVEKHADEVIITNNGFGYRIIELDVESVNTWEVNLK